MLNFDFLEKGLEIVFPSHFENDLSRKMVLVLYLLTDQISLSGYLYFLRYWPKCVLQLCVNQVMTS